MMKNKILKRIISVFMVVFVLAFSTPSVSYAEYPTPTLEGDYKSIKRVLIDNIPASVYIEVENYMGSGFIIECTDLYVYIMTNRHVTLLAPKNIKVKFYEGTKAEAKLWYESTDMDAAVVRVEKKNIPASVLNRLQYVLFSEEKSDVGDRVGIIARHPDSTLFTSEGVIDRFEYECYFTDGMPEEGTLATYPCQAGTSGSAVFNDAGYVVGLHKGRTYDGYSFYIEGSKVKKDYNQIRNRTKQMKTLINRK